MITTEQEAASARLHLSYLRASRASRAASIRGAMMADDMDRDIERVSAELADYEGGSQHDG